MKTPQVRRTIRSFGQEALRPWSPFSSARLRRRSEPAGWHAQWQTASSTQARLTSRSPKSSIAATHYAANSSPS